ncbi:MAG: hypothetical protein M3R35_02685, partial [Candidatus Eremiobacteraeota bacterium]|nr:hypothetical protein [Candidatus Eremiobacteraeota bacterium]
MFVLLSIREVFPELGYFHGMRNALRTFGGPGAALAALPGASRVALDPLTARLRRAGCTGKPGAMPWTNAKGN